MGQQVQLGAFTQYDSEVLLVNDPFLHSLASQTVINPHRNGRRFITLGSALALTLAAPDSGADDGVQIQILSTTAFAHTLTATGLLKTGSSSVNVATFAAFGGAGLTLVAFGGKWFVLYSTGITFS